ncbi:hypothetical protein BZA70DRAFT_292640 [Myxozyma melibiosi]|uniref:Arrestin C-terminal-like domain-containing protein n=1 Tax=Myxozyma melibiosi TaxID=54550 RepID=A0ABR1FBY5_9ASCO
MPLTISIRGPPNADFVLGYPGIDASWPRICGVVEVRSKTGGPFRLKTLELQLYRSEEITVHTARVMKQMRKETYAVGRPVQLHDDSSRNSYLSMSFPFIYTLPFAREMELPSSMHIPKTASTIYSLQAAALEDDIKVTDYVRTFCPITILRYDTISVFSEFRQQQTVVAKSDDSLVDVALTLDRIAFGPGDPVHMVIDIVPNPDLQYKSSKVKIKSIYIDLQEIINFGTVSDGIIPKIKTIQAEKLDMANHISLGNQAHQQDITFTFPVPKRTNREVLQRDEAASPNTLLSSFTQVSALYSVSFILKIGVRFSGCKDVELNHTLTVTPFDSATCQALLYPLNNAIKTTVGATPLQPTPTFIKANDPVAASKLGITMSGQQRSLWIE